MFQPLLTKQKPIHFKRFSRKGYSAFCVCRNVTIGVLRVCVLGAACAVQAVADTPAHDTMAVDWDDGGSGGVNLEELEVTASLQSLSAGRRARVVAVITREEIAQAAAHTPADLLKLATGVDVRQRGGFGVQNDVSIDGGTHDQVTILLNGVNITSPQTGHYSADWPVSLDDIERIEVLEGGASRIMGGSSLMGAINIVTRPDAQTNFSAGAEGGSFGTYGAAVRGGYASTKVRNQVSGAFRNSDGGTINSDFVRRQAYYQGTLTTSKLNLEWQAGISYLSHGANTFYSAAYPNQHDALKRYIVSATASTHGRIKLEPQIYWQRVVDHYQLVKDSDFGENFHYTDAYGGRINAITTWVAGTTTLGAEARHESIYSTNLGTPLPESEWKHICGQEGLYYTKHDSRTHLSFYLEHNVTLDRFNLSGGLVAASNSGLDKVVRLYPGVDVSYSPIDGLRVFTSWSQSFRMPTFTDLYSNAPTQVGNRDLRPEFLKALQAGVAYETTGYAMHLHGFYHRGKNMIDWVMYTADDVYHSTGFDLDNIGISVEGSLRFQSLWGKHQLFKQLTASYTYMHQTRHDAQVIYKSRYALEYLKHKFTASLTHRVAGPVSASWSVRWQDRCGNYIVYDNAQSTGELRSYRPYAVLDLRLDCSIGNWLIYIDATNLTNHKYYDYGNIPQPGLWIMAGAKINLKFKH